MRLMHPLRAHGLSLLAMLLLLLGTAAPALARMTCVAGGHTVVNVGQAADCCPTDHHHQATTVSATCCELLQAQPQRTDFVQGTGAMVPLLFAMVLPATVHPVVALAPVVRYDAHFSRPPPLLQAQRLATFGLFLI